VALRSRLCCVPGTVYILRRKGNVDFLSNEMPFAVFVSKTPTSCSAGCKIVTPSVLKRGASMMGVLDLKLGMWEIVDRFQRRSCASTSYALSVCAKIV
jgi:hypothetical protein